MKVYMVRLLFIGATALAAAQLVQPLAPTPECRTTRTHEFFTDPTVDPSVREILKRSCADCHSNQEHLPWYAHVAPMSWLIAGHIERGRLKLNFSEWPEHSRNLRQDIADSIDKDEMPLPSYLWVHGSARLTMQEKGTIEQADLP